MKQIKKILVMITKGILILFFKFLHIILHSKKIDDFTSGFITGESLVIKKILKNYIKVEKPTLFDVGSNEGYYSMKLRRAFPLADIYAFEANSHTLNKVLGNFKKEKINFFNIGLASSTGTGLLYDYKNNLGSEHASIYKEVITETHGDKNYSEIKFEKDTVDNFCSKHNIEKIDFIKIDTEGGEFDVLKGATNMLANDKIDIIQFEFNAMNVVSRVFLKDFYTLLKNYSISRIEYFGLVSLPQYKAENEIFKYQNFLAINKKLLK